VTRSRSISATTEIFIKRDPDFVFAYFADLRNEPEWNRGHVRDVVKTSRGPIGLGTTFEGIHPGIGRATWRLSRYEPPAHVVIDGAVGGDPYRYIGDLEPREGGTRFRGRVEWVPSGLWSVLGPLLSVVLSAQTRRSFRNLGSAVERASSPCDD
jgi:hypothetical protein